MKIEKSHFGFIFFVLAYPLTHYIVSFIPNPFVPNANIAINMIFPILAGYFYGPVSGLIAGAIGTGIAGLWFADIYDALAVFPHAMMGYVAGLAGEKRQQFLASLSVVVGHLLNILFFWRFDLIEIQKISVLILGLLTETTIDIVAIILFIVLFHKLPYFNPEGKW